MSNRTVVNQSRVKAWRTCHRQHWYKFEMKLTKKRKRRPLVFGTIVHKMVEAYANADDPWETFLEIASTQRKMFLAEKEVYGDIVQDVKYIMAEYFRYWSHASDLRYIRFNRRGAEHTFEIELEKGLVWKGTIDAFGKSKGLRWLIEHKTFNKEWSEDERWRNLQSLTYRRAAKLMGWPVVDGTMWDYIWSKSPTRPKRLKSGELSSRAIVTLPDTIRDFIKEQGLRPSQWKAMMDQAEECVPKYFQRVYTPANEEIEEKVVDDFLETAYEIVQNHDRKKARNIGRHCSFCEYESICRADLQGADVDFVMEREYEIDQDR